MILVNRLILVLMCLVWSSSYGFCNQSEDAAEKDRYDQIQSTQDYINALEAKRARASYHVPVEENQVQAVPQQIAVAKVEVLAEESPAVYPHSNIERSAPTPIKEEVAPLTNVAPVKKYSYGENSYPEITKEHQFEIAPDAFYLNYNEPEAGEKRKGSFEGIALAYTLHPRDSQNWLVNVFHTDAHADYGIVNYKFDKRINNVKNYIAEPRAWFGKDINIASDVRLTPYVGAGYRWYYQQLKNKTSDDGDGGNNIQTQYFYVPAGAELSLRFADGWRILLNGEYDHLFWGAVTRYLSQYDPDYATLNNTLKKGYGIRSGIKIIKENTSINLFAEPYFRYWNINQSKAADVMALGISQGIWQEENNKTYEMGMRLGAQF